jgi:TonB-dependent receptor
MLHTSRRGLNTKLALLGATMLAGLSPALAQAQDQAAPTQSTAAQSTAAKDDSTVVVVTGYRASLTSATKAKKDSTNFTETIFAEDLGKFPDLNLAESMQRVPGMIVQRDALTGDGTQISVRALPSAFTLVTMNGNRVAVASDFGFTGSSSPNRQVDLDMFPTDLFNRVDVNKTPSADTMEGGVAGTVNIQNARPFDHKGPHLVLSIQDSYNMNARASSPRATFVASNTWNKLGALVGVTTTQKKIFSDGFETVGWGDPNLANYCTGCDPAAQFGGPNGTLSANQAGSNQFKFGNTVYSYTGNGLTPGTTLTEANLLALNPGLTEAQIKGALLPRLGRNYLLDGTSKNTVGLIALEYHASDTLKFHLDVLGGQAERNALRADMMWAVRSTGPGDSYNGGMIPLNMSVDSNDVVTGGTFANSAFLDENNEYHDKTGMASVDAGFQWKPIPSLTWNTEVATMHSTYERDVTFMKFLTPFQSNITVNYANKSGNDIPTINTNVNLDDPNLGWRNFQFILQRDRRSVTSKSLHSDLSWDLDDNLTLKTGYDYDSYTRTINVYDNSSAFNTAWNNAVTPSTIGQFLEPMNVSHYMNGVSGTGYTNFIIPNWGKIQQAIGYSSLISAKGNVTTGTTYNGAGASDISEKVNDAYLMAYDRTMIGNIPVKTNFGFRFQNTDQVVTSPNNLNGQILIIRTEHRYHDVLPSFNAVANVTENLNLRFAASKTMTRANPSQMSSQLGYSDPGGQNASEGNPNLKPYYSNNIDVGGEYYTSKTGYVGLTLFAKDIKNFTFNKAVVEPFAALGIPFSSITTQQQNAIATQLGTTAAAINSNPALLDGFNVNVTQPVNAAERLKLTGQEFMWVQPLDFALKGLGYTFNYTHFHVSDVFLQAGVPDFTYNFTAFYERGGFSTHISYVDVGKMTIGTMPSPNSIPYNWFGAQRHQIDLSASYKFKAYGLNQSITLDGINLDRQGYYSYLGFKNVRYSYNNPGTTILLGWRAQY